MLLIGLNSYHVKLVECQTQKLSLRYAIGLEKKTILNFSISFNGRLRMIINIKYKFFF